MKKKIENGIDDLSSHSLYFNKVKVHARQNGIVVGLQTEVNKLAFLLQVRWNDPNPKFKNFQLQQIFFQEFISDFDLIPMYDKTHKEENLFYNTFRLLYRHPSFSSTKYTFKKPRHII